MSLTPFVYVEFERVDGRKLKVTVHTSGVPIHTPLYVVIGSRLIPLERNLDLGRNPGTCYWETREPISGVPDTSLVSIGGIDGISASRPRLPESPVRVAAADYGTPVVIASKYKDSSAMNTWVVDIQARVDNTPGEQISMVDASVVDVNGNTLAGPAPMIPDAGDPDEYEKSFNFMWTEPTNVVVSVMSSTVHVTTCVIDS